VVDSTRMRPRLSADEIAGRVDKTRHAASSGMVGFSGVRLYVGRAYSGAAIAQLFRQ